MMIDISTLTGIKISTINNKDLGDTSFNNANAAQARFHLAKMLQHQFQTMCKMFQPILKIPSICLNCTVSTKLSTFVKHLAIAVSSYMKHKDVKVMMKMLIYLINSPHMLCLD